MGNQKLTLGELLQSQDRYEDLKPLLTGKVIKGFSTTVYSLVPDDDSQVVTYIGVTDTDKDRAIQKLADKLNDFAVNYRIYGVLHPCIQFQGAGKGKFITASYILVNKGDLNCVFKNRRDKMKDKNELKEKPKLDELKPRDITENDDCYSVSEDSIYLRRFLLRRGYKLEELSDYIEDMLSQGILGREMLALSGRISCLEGFITKNTSFNGKAVGFKDYEKHKETMEDRVFALNASLAIRGELINKIVEALDRLSSDIIRERSDKGEKFVDFTQRVVNELIDEHDDSLDSVIKKEDLKLVLVMHENKIRLEVSPKMHRLFRRYSKYLNPMVYPLDIVK